MEQKILNSLDNPIEFKINPEILALIPRPSKEEYDALKYSIQQFGQKKPITIASDGTILDGHTTYTILQELGSNKIKYQIEPSINIQNIQSVKEYVYTINNRRNLNLYQRATIALNSVSANLQKRGEKDYEFKLLELSTKISKRTLYTVCSINEKLKAGKGTPEMEEKLNTGELTINEANLMLKNAEEFDNEIFLIKDKKFQQEMKEKYEDKKYGKNTLKQLQEEINKHDNPEVYEKEEDTYHKDIKVIYQKSIALEKKFPNRIAIFDATNREEWKIGIDYIHEHLEKSGRKYTVFISELSEEMQRK